MLANNRTARVNGLRWKVDTNSIKPTSGRRATGTDFGQMIAVMYEARSSRIQR